MSQNQEPNSDDSFARRSPVRGNLYADDALPLEDDEVEDEPQFRRVGKRVPVRRSGLPRKTTARLKLAFGALATLVVLGTVFFVGRDFLLHSPRFVLRDEANIEFSGAAPNSREAVMQVMRQSVGRNLFQISLDEQQRELEKIAWVETATVARLWPNRLRVEVRERVPVAFVAWGEQTELIDASGVILEMPLGGPNYSFPVIVGMNENEPLSTRAAQMKFYLRLIHELDSNKMHYSANLDEVDLSDPDDVKVMARGGLASMQVDLGTSDFLSKFMIFLSNIQKWEQERGKLESVDLRYGSEVILKAAAPDAAADQPAAPATNPPATEPAVQPKAEPKAKPEAKPELRTKSAAALKTKNKAEDQARSEVKTKSKTKSKAETKVEAEPATAKTKLKGKAEGRVKPEAGADRSRAAEKKRK